MRYARRKRSAAARWWCARKTSNLSLLAKEASALPLERRARLAVMAPYLYGVAPGAVFPQLERLGQHQTRSSGTTVRDPAHLPSLIGLGVEIAPPGPRSELRRGDSRGEGSAPAKTSDKFPHLREVTRPCCVENGCADRWGSKPNGARLSRGRGRSSVEAGPTLALWRSVAHRGPPPTSQRGGGPPFRARLVRSRLW